MGECQRVPGQHESTPLPIWQELMASAEYVYLQISPVYWGFGVPHGDGAGVVLVPGFLVADYYLKYLHDWLERIGYKPYYSGIGVNAECPNLLIRRHLVDTVRKAHTETRRKVHVIGHSLGGMLARAVGAQMPECVASVITLGTPLQKVVCHPSVLRVVEAVRKRILEKNGESVLPSCYTGACTCDFLESITATFPKSVRQTAVYTTTDGFVDWRVCTTGDPAVDVEVTATHIGMVYSPLVFSILADRLARK